VRGVATISARRRRVRRGRHHVRGARVAALRVVYGPARRVQRPWARCDEPCRIQHFTSLNYEDGDPREYLLVVRALRARRNATRFVPHFARDDTRRRFRCLTTGGFQCTSCLACPSFEARPCEDNVNRASKYACVVPYHETALQRPVGNWTSWR